MNRGNEPLLYKISDACRILGVKQGILRKWDADGQIKSIRTPGGMRLFDIASIDTSSVLKAKEKEDPVVVLYSRVSSSKQKDDLERQREYLQSNLPDEYSRCKLDHVQDIGSGLNFKRPGLLQVLGRVKSGGVSTIVVASRDRLARFGFELIEWLCTEFGTKLVVLDPEDSTPESELGKDLMSIVQVYCCRWNGKRRYAKRASSSVEAQAQANNRAEGEASSLGGMLEVPLQQDDGNPNESQEQDFA